MKKLEAFRKSLTNVSSFTGLMRLQGKTVYCAYCKKEQAMWLHRRKKDGSMVPLCFGCGDH